MRVCCLCLLYALPLLAQPPATRELFRQAMANQRAGRTEQAIAAYREILRNEPRLLDARINLGAALAQAGQYDAAITEYQAALRQDRLNLPVRLNLGIALYKQERIAQAAEQFAAVRALRPDQQQATLLLADCLLRQGAHQDVIGLLSAVQDQGANDRTFAYLLGTAYARAGNEAAAQPWIEKLFRAGSPADAELMLGALKLEKGDFQGALASLKKAEELNPQLPGLYTLLGRAKLNDGDPQGALNAFRQELARSPNDFDAHLYLGSLLRQEKEFDEAARLLARAAQLRPDSLAVRFQLGAIHLAQGELARATQELEAVVAADPNFVEGHVQLATAYYRQKRKADGDRARAVVQRLTEEAQRRELKTK